MDKKVNYMTLGREGIAKMNEFDAYLNKYDMDPILRELMKIRTSQINGCAYCLDVHTKLAIQLGEDQRRIFTLSAWRDSDLFSPSDKAALALTDAVTAITKEGVPTEVYDDFRLYFSDEEYVMFVMVINHMNTWNRMSISMGNKAQ